jgi:hypothetical protein
MLLAKLVFWLHFHTWCWARRHFIGNGGRAFNKSQYRARWCAGRANSTLASSCLSSLLDKSFNSPLSLSLSLWKQQPVLQSDYPARRKVNAESPSDASACLICPEQGRAAPTPASLTYIKTMHESDAYGVNKPTKRAREYIYIRAWIVVVQRKLRGRGNLKQPI